jgi:hypothetical protein
MKTYNNYQISKTSQENVYMAFKYKAEYKNGIRFSHLFYFTYSKSGNCEINGKTAMAFNPSYNDNYYQANALTGVVLSQDMEKFSFQDSSLGYVNYAPISIEEMSKLDYSENEN